MGQNITLSELREGSCWENDVYLCALYYAWSTGWVFYKLPSFSQLLPQKTMTAAEKACSQVPGLHAPAFWPPGIWRTWTPWSAGRGGRQSDWWCTPDLDTSAAAWRWVTQSGDTQAWGCRIMHGDFWAELCLNLSPCVIKHHLILILFPWLIVNS